MRRPPILPTVLLVLLATVLVAGAFRATLDRADEEANRPAAAVRPPVGAAPSVSSPSAPATEPAAAEDHEAADVWTRIRGHLHDHSGTPLADVLIRVERTDRGSRQPWRNVRSRSDGAFEVRVQAPGRYALRTESYLHETVERDVAVGLRDAPIVGLGLQRLPGAGTVRGRVLSESGRYRRPVTVALAPPDRLCLWRVDVHWRASDRGWIGEFAFEDVPWAEYAIRLEPQDDDYREWTALEQRVRPPQADLEFVCLDADQAVDLALSVHDAETGAEIPDFDVCLAYDNPWQAPRCRSGTGGVRLFDVPRSPRLRWTVSAQGYESQAGDLESTELEPAGECDPEQRLSIPLQRTRPEAPDDLLRRDPPGDPPATG